MSIPHDEMTLLQAQLEGLESIFFELFPFGVALKRQQVQDYYNKRFNTATEAQASVARGELKRNFNTRANQVRNLVDSAESIGSVENKFNLISAAACLPDERDIKLPTNIFKFCQSLLFENKVDPDLLKTVFASNNYKDSEIRVLLASVMFTGNKHVKHGDSDINLRDLLANIVSMIRAKDLLPRNDPFFNEALYFIEGMEDDA